MLARFVFGFCYDHGKTEGMATKKCLDRRLKPARKAK